MTTKEALESIVKDGIRLGAGDYVELEALKVSAKILGRHIKGQLVEVVRCKDCKHWHEEIGWCDENSHFFNDGMSWDVFERDDFCSYGEKK